MELEVDAHLSGISIINYYLNAVIPIGSSIAVASKLYFYQSMFKMLRTLFMADRYRLLHHKSVRLHKWHQVLQVVHK